MKDNDIIGVERHEGQATILDVVKTMIENRTDHIGVTVVYGDLKATVDIVLEKVIFRGETLYDVEEC